MIYIMRLYLSKKQCLCSLVKRFSAILDCLCKDFSIPKFTFLLVDQVSSRGRFKFKISGLPWKLLLSTFSNLLHTWVGPELKVKPLELPIFSLNDYMFLSNAVLFLNEAVHILHLLQHLIFVVLDYLRWYLVVAVAVLRYTVAGDWYLFGTVGETVLLCSAICHGTDVAEMERCKTVFCVVIGVVLELEILCKISVLHF